MRGKYWVKYFLYLVRIFLMVFLLALLLPLFIGICSALVSSLWNQEREPHGNFQRVEILPSLNESVVSLEFEGSKLRCG